MSRSAVKLLPLSVDVFGHSFRVFRGGNDYIGEADLLKGGGGCCNSTDQFICVSTEMHEERRRAVFLHECVEAANEVMNLNMDHNQITVMGNLMYQMEKR